MCGRPTPPPSASPPAQATAFKNAAGAMRGKVTDQTKAKEAAKAATEAVVDSESALRSTASDLVRAIRSFAENGNNPGVYTIAQIPCAAGE